MSWQVVFEAPAQAEIAAAFAWYEEKSYGLGGEFLRVVATASEQLGRNPEAYASSPKSRPLAWQGMNLTRSGSQQ